MYCKSIGSMLRTAAMAVMAGLFFTACGGPVGLQTADELFAKKDYVKAAEGYEQVLQAAEDSSTRKQVGEKLAKVQVLIADQYTGRVDDRLAGIGEPTLPQLGELSAMLHDVSRWDDDRRTILAKISLLDKKSAALVSTRDGLLREAETLSGRFNHDAGLAAVAKADAIDPGNGDISSLRKTIENRKELTERVSALIAAGDVEGASKKFNDLAATYATAPDISTAPFAKDFMALIREKTAVMKDDGEWLEAIDYLKTWSIPELDKDVRDAYRGAAAYFYEGGKAALADGKPGKAYLYSLKAAELDGKDMKIFNLNKNARDAVDKEIQSYIAVASFDSPSDDPDAGRQFSDSLISFLYQVLPYGINILERDKIDYVLKENRNETSKAGDVLGVDLVVTGTVSLFRVESSVDKRSATTKVTVGEETVENPEFTQMARLHGPDTTTWPEVPPKTIQKGNVQLLKYTKGTGEKKGFAKVSVRIFDTEKGTITFVKDYDGKVAKVSEFQDEVADAGIEYIPMNLPTDTELKEEMRKGIVQEIARVVQASFENRETRFLNEVQFYLDRREKEASLEPLAGGYLYCLQDGIESTSPAFAELTRLIEEMVR